MLMNSDLKDKVHTQSYCKTYTIKLEREKAYQIELTTTSFPGVVRVETVEGSALANSTNQFGGPRVIVMYTPAKTQDYQLVVTSQNANSTGKFSLVVKDASAYSVLSVSSKLDQNDKQYANAGNKRHKMFLANLEKGKTYQIDMTSGAFDSYLYLESPDGKVLAQDDDGGGYPSARIIYTATETGKFRVITTHFGGGGNLGDFNLSVRQTEGGGGPINKRFDKDKGFEK
jgi:hypothetical protein